MRLRRSPWLFGLAAGLFATAAVAGGSLPFAEVMAFARDYPELARQLDRLVAEEKADPGSLVCSGIRLGNQWPHLGGARVLPFECEIGRRTVTIDGMVQFLDRKGTVIATVIDGDEAEITARVFRNARSVRMSEPRLKIE